jgi:hypothetical protein
MDAKITQATQGSRDLFSLLSVVVLFMYLHTSAISHRLRTCMAQVGATYSNGEEGAARSQHARHLEASAIQTLLS